MSSKARIAANRKNALRSTGPRTAAGKSCSAMNRLTHGLRSATVTIPGEDLSEWQQFRDRIVRSLAPGDPLEEELAHRVAVCLWRARRCGALETIHASIEESLANAPFASDRNDIEDAEREVESAEQSLGWNQTALDALAGPSPLTGLTDMPDAEHLSGDRVGDMFREFTDVGYTGFDYHRREFLLAAGLPESATKEPFEWDGRTAGLVRKALGILAKNQSLDMAEVVSEAMTGRAERRRSAKASVAEGERAVERAQEGVRLVEARPRRSGPGDAICSRIRDRVPRRGARQPDSGPLHPRQQSPNRRASGPRQQESKGEGKPVADQRRGTAPSVPGFKAKTRPNLARHLGCDCGRHGPN